MDAASQPAPPRHRTPRRTYTATRMSHPKYNRATHRPAELPGPLTHLWRPPATAGAGGHTQVDSGTPPGAVDSPRRRRPGSYVARPGRAAARPAHNPSATLASSPSVVGPACTPAATHHDPRTPAPVKAARAQPSHRHHLNPRTHHLLTPTTPGHYLRRQEPRGSGSPAKRGCDIQVPPRSHAGNLQPGIFLS